MSRPIVQPVWSSSRQLWDARGSGSVASSVAAARVERASQRASQLSSRQQVDKSIKAATVPPPSISEATSPPHTGLPQPTTVIPEAPSPAALKPSSTLAPTTAPDLTLAADLAPPARERNSLKRSSLKTFSQEEVWGVVQILKEFDKGGKGSLNEAEVTALLEVLMIDGSFAELDTDGDGRVDLLELFVWQTGCTLEEAIVAFAEHEALFREWRSKPPTEWSAEQVRTVLTMFNSADKDGSGSLDADEWREFLELLMIDEELSGADSLVADGKLSLPEFFMWHTGCSAEEAVKVFAEHEGLFRTWRGSQAAPWAAAPAASDEPTIPIFEDGNTFIFACPQCSDLVTVERHQIHCRVFRHGVYKSSLQAIDPHTPKEECERLVSEGRIYGCGRPFFFDGTVARKSDFV